MGRASADVEAIPPRSSRANAYAEWFLLTARTDESVADLSQEQTKRCPVLGRLIYE